MQQRCQSRKFPRVLPELRRRIAASHLRTLISAILVCITVCICALMPLTEIAFSGDGFMLGGHDSELTLLAFALFISLVLLLAERVQAKLLVPSLAVHSASRTPRHLRRFFLTAVRVSSIPPELSEPPLTPAVVPLRI